jgi:hypothetical protein
MYGLTSREFQRSARAMLHLGNAHAQPRNRHLDAIATKHRPATLAMRGHNGAYEEKMFHSRFQRTVCALALAGAVGCGSFAARAEDRDHDRDDDDHHVKTVFVVAMENHNWTQPGSQASPQQIFQNPAAPFINSLVNGTSGISSQVAFANAYINAGTGVHPSEPNYIWAEAGTNFGVTSDADPYNKTTCAPQTVQTTNQHLSAFLTVARRDWKSYQEDTDIDITNNAVLPQSAWTVPLFSQSGSFSGSPASNAYNYTKQFNYAAKHNPMVYFTDTNGGCNASPTNPLRQHYAPLQQLALDLADDKVADYNWITPNQYNDQHSTLANGYGQFPTAAARPIPPRSRRATTSWRGWCR